MARSVSRPSNAVFVFYGLHELYDEFDCEELLGNLRHGVKAKYPSFEYCNEWIGREDQAILENGHGYIGLSEYMGIVAVWGVARDWTTETFYSGDPDTTGLHAHWMASIEAGVREVAHQVLNEPLAPGGTFSNGEQVFTPVGRPEGVVTSKEGTLW